MKAHVRSDPRAFVVGSVAYATWFNPNSQNPDTMFPVLWEDGTQTLVRRDELMLAGELEGIDMEAFEKSLAWAQKQAKIGGWVAEGVGPDAPTETNENGASQSKTGFAATSLPPKALLAVAATQKHGDDKYGVDNWRGISVLDHLNHAQIHYLAHMAGDTQDKHLEHYATRALMALELHLEQNGVTANDEAEA